MSQDADKNTQKEIEELLRQAQAAARGGSADARQASAGAEGAPATAVKIPSSTVGPGAQSFAGDQIGRAHV